MARRKSTTRSVLLIIILSLACFGGYTLWNSHVEPAYDVAKTKYGKIRRALKE